MTSNASAPAEPESSRSGEYEEMLAALDTAIQEAVEKVESGRVYNPENEKVRAKWIRTLAYAVNIRRQVTVDRDLEDLAERIERIEEQRGEEA